MTQNIFNLDEPDQYECFVRRFYIGHGTLTVVIRRKDNRTANRYLVFSSVEYFSGAIRWYGANFTIKPDDEALALLRKVERFENYSDEKLLSPPSYRLYEVQTKFDKIRILAWRANLVNSMSEYDDALDDETDTV